MDDAQFIKMLYDTDSECDFSLSDSDVYVPSSSGDTALSHDNDPDVSSGEDSDQPTISVPRWIQPADGSTLKKISKPPTKNRKAIPHVRTLYGYFSLFVTDKILLMIVEETNRNAQQYMSSHRIRKHSRLSKSKDTSTEEIKKFLYLVMYMGLVKYPGVSGYWSRDPMFANQFCSKVISRNRFQLLLRFLLFEDNNNPKSENEKFYKIKRILSKMMQNFIKILERTL